MRLPILGMLLLVAGCERPAQPLQQYDELKRIDSGTKPVPTLSDGTPIVFDAITISVVGPNNSTLGARSEWKLTGSLDAVQEQLKAKVLLLKPSAGPGPATSLTLRFSYFDEAGNATGSDSLDLALADKGRVQLNSLGTAGRVARIDAALESITWGNETVAVKEKR